MSRKIDLQARLPPTQKQIRERYRKMLASLRTKPLSDVYIGAEPKYYIIDGKRRRSLPPPNYAQPPPKNYFHPRETG